MNSFIPSVQQDRLKFIDFKLMFQGHFTRAEIVQQFKLGLFSATQDINLYRDTAPQNFVYDHQQKCYYQANQFRPLFVHDTKAALAKLAYQDTNTTGLNYQSCTQLNMPNVEVFACISRALLNNKAIEIEYVSLTTGNTKRTIVPHAIADSGLRLHVRAFDCLSQQFRDFVISRIVRANLSEQIITDEQHQQYDQLWQQTIELELVPHPHNIDHPSAIELDYGMSQGRLVIKTRIALAQYILKRWNVDCSTEANQHSAIYQLWLQNSSALQLYLNPPPVQAA